MNLELTDKVAIVTGSSRGIGLGSARALEDARRVLRAALVACLEGRPLATRVVAQSMARKAAR